MWKIITVDYGPHVSTTPFASQRTANDMNSLTYSKINSRTKKPGTDKNRTKHDDTITTSIDLSALIEDSVDTLIAGNHFRALSSSVNSSGEHQLGGKVDERDLEAANAHFGPLVNLTIEKCPSWQVVTDAPVWARCVMNVLGNALKYTEDGFIDVRLWWAPVPTDRWAEDSRIVKLSVTDTGRGISTAYLRSHLYQPFLQEHASSNGLGLGLSIVKKMIDGIHGSINIQSTVGKGTNVELSVPVSVDSSDKTGCVLNLKHAGKTICFVGETHEQYATSNGASDLPSREDTAATVSDAMSLYCKQWLGMDVSYARTIGDVVADVMAVFEQDLDTIQGSNDSDQNDSIQRPGSALLVISSASISGKRHDPLKHDGIFYVAPPFGPKRLGSIIEQALNYTDKAKNGTVSSSSLEINGKMAAMARKRETEINGQPTTVIAHKASTRHRPEPEVQGNGKGDVLTALIVDDNAVNVALLERCLKRWRVSCKTASNGKEAVEAFRNPEHNFDYILMDISMPVMNGIEATRLIRDLEHEKSSSTRTRIIAMTGLGDDRTRQEALANGMDVFLTKPVRLRDVKTLLHIK